MCKYVDTEQNPWLKRGAVTKLLRKTKIIPNYRTTQRSQDQKWMTFKDFYVWKDCWMNIIGLGLVSSQKMTHKMRYHIELVLVSLIRDNGHQEEHFTNIMPVN